MTKSDTPQESTLRKAEHALIGTLVANLIAGIIAATLLYAQVKEHDRRLDRLELSDRDTAQKNVDAALALAELRSVIASLRETVSDLKQAVRR